MTGCQLSPLLLQAETGQVQLQGLTAEVLRSEHVSGWQLSQLLLQAETGQVQLQGVTNKMLRLENVLGCPHRTLLRRTQSPRAREAHACARLPNQLPVPAAGRRNRLAARHQSVVEMGWTASLARWFCGRAMAWLGSTNLMVAVT